MSENYSAARLDSEINDALGDDDCNDFTKFVPNSTILITSYSNTEEEIAITKRNRSGVARGLPRPMKNKDGKLDKSQLTPIYMGVADRDVLAEIVVRRMDQLGWSLRDAAQETKLQKTMIERLRNGTASFKQYEQHIDKFGLSIAVSVFEKSLD